MTAEDNWWNTR